MIETYTPRQVEYLGKLDRASYAVNVAQDELLRNEGEATEVEFKTEEGLWRRITVDGAFVAGAKKVAQSQFEYAREDGLTGIAQEIVDGRIGNLPEIGTIFDKNSI